MKENYQIHEWKSRFDQFTVELFYQSSRICINTLPHEDITQ